MDPGDLVERWQRGPLVISAPLYFDAADLLEELRRSFVIVHLVEAQADVVLYALTLETGGERSEAIRFTGCCRLAQQTGHCRIALKPDTLAGTMELIAWE